LGQTKDFKALLVACKNGATIRPHGVSERCQTK